MSIDLSLIIPNKCRSLRDKVEARHCFDDTIERIVKYFHGRPQFVTDINIIEDEDEPRYEFEIPSLNVTAIMQTGFWDVWPVASYSHYFYWYQKDMNGKPKPWARDVCFNVVRAFGLNEGWVCDEYHSWNTPKDYPPTFEDWMTYGDAPEDSIVHEFNLMDFADFSLDAHEWPNYHAKYHDTFKECHAVLDTLKQKYPQYEVLADVIPLPHHALVAKEDDLYLLDVESGKLLTDGPIDNCRTDFNGAGVQLFRGEKSAFFNDKGKQLTDFRVGNFSWKWDDSKKSLRARIRCPNSVFQQVVKDHATGKRFYTDGTPCLEDDES